jgi:acyl carrier protein
MSEQALKNILSRVLNIPADSIDQDTSASTIFSWDSLNHMIIIGALRDELSCAIPLNEIKDSMSFSYLLNLVLQQADNQ